jgi:hypothetical protein
MINKLRILLLSAAFFCTLVLAPAAFAHTTQAQVSAQPKSVAVVTQPQSQKEYDRGWTKGYQDTLRTCLELKQRPRDFAQRRVITDYDRGYYDGSEFALQNSQACRNLN